MPGSRALMALHVTCSSDSQQGRCPRGISALVPVQAPGLTPNIPFPAVRGHLWNHFKCLHPYGLVAVGMEDELSPLRAGADPSLLS